MTNYIILVSGILLLMMVLISGMEKSPIKIPIKVISFIFGLYNVLYSLNHLGYVETKVMGIGF